MALVTCRMCATITTISEPSRSFYSLSIIKTTTGGTLLYVEIKKVKNAAFSAF